MNRIQTLKSIAKKIEIESLFHQGGTIIGAEKIMSKHKFKHDRGKYDASQTITATHEYNWPIWYERRRNNDGPYIQLMTVSDIPETQRILEIYRTWKEKNKEVMPMQ